MGGGHLHSMGTCYRPMHTSESIHEGGERASEHLEEWISHGNLLRSTECGMFQNVRDTSAVQGYGTEPNTGWEGGMHSGKLKYQGWDQDNTRLGYVNPWMGRVSFPRLGIVP